MHLTLLMRLRTHLGGSRLVHACLPGRWKTSRRGRDARVYVHTTAVIHEISTRCPSPPDLHHQKQKPQQAKTARRGSFSHDYCTHHKLLPQQWLTFDMMYEPYLNLVEYEEFARLLLTAKKKSGWQIRRCDGNKMTNIITTNMTNDNTNVVSYK